MATVLQANITHLEDIVPLFNEYRIFYGMESDENAARTFLKERIIKEESIIFLAYQDVNAIGFTQLYKTFSSVSLQGFFILNDLYVNEGHRKNNVGEALLEKAKSYCKMMNYKGLALETATDNPAQKLYEKLGWKKDDHCFHYFWMAKS
ncbi:GNAT family N-acetyltransferase [Maribacter sp. 2210JD10-5]|uniref:GNAT family N-acetyltransferase n=1 Tax=Maribacter sp. 2210JD10-5 TaxID=3386272 RepID=UPI0039BC9F1E